MFQSLQHAPEVGLLLAVGIGAWVGSWKIGGFSLGTVTAALMVGLVVGNFWEEPSADLRSGFFLLFLFANGYSVGPQFIQAVRSSGLKPMVMSVTVVGTGIAAAVAFARILHLDLGSGAGLFSGSMTASAAMGTAAEAIRNLDMPKEQIQQFTSNIFVVDALTYVFGAVGVILFCSFVAPWILGIDLRQEARKLEEDYGIHAEQAGVFSAAMRFTVRGLRLAPDSALIGRRVQDAEVLEPGRTVFVVRVRRGAEVVEATPDLVLTAGDEIAVYGSTPAVVAFLERNGTEVTDAPLLDFPVTVLSVFVTSGEWTKLDGFALRRLPETRNVTVRSVRRGGELIPTGGSMRLEKGDVVELVGPLADVERVAKHVGYPLRPGTATDLSTVGFGVFLGAFIGAPFVMLGAFKLTLGLSVGVLLLGLFTGWLRTVRPMLATIPEPAVQLMINLGLAVFVAGAGMHAGPVFIDAVRRLGAVVLAAGVVITILPQLAALLVGRYVLRMNPVLLLGALAGAQTYTGALAAVQEKCGSRVAVLGYTVPYATSNVLLTTGGAVVVGLLAG